MSTVQPFPAGGYRFITHQFQYSGGVAAELGFRIERARFTRPVALAVAFDAIEDYLGGIGRPPTALCACELRSPAQFTDAGFVARVIGDALRSRTDGRQTTEVAIAVASLNHMLELGRPEYVRLT